MQAIMEQAKQNEQRLENIIAENERLRQDLALEVAKSKQAVHQDPERPREQVVDDLEPDNKTLIATLTHYPRSPRRRGDLKLPVPLKRVHI